MLLILFGAAIYGRTLRYASNWSSLIGFGCLAQGPCLATANRAGLPHSAIVFQTGGYDGQFFYYMANQLANRHAARLDDPVLRWSRPGWPVLLAPFARWGGPQGLLVAMISLPILLHFGLLWFLLATIPKHAGLPNADFYLLLALYALHPVFWLGSQLATADGIATDLMLVAIIVVWQSSARRSQRLGPSGPALGYLTGLLLASLAVLTKESAALYLALFFTLPGLMLRQRLILAGLPAMVLISWWAWIGFTPLGQAALHATGPGESLWAWLAGSSGLFTGTALSLLWVAVFGLLLCTLSIQSWQAQQGFPGLWIGILILLGGSLFLLLMAGPEYYQNYANLARIASPLAGILFLLAFLTNRRGPLFQTRTARIAFMLAVFVQLAWNWWAWRDIFRGGPLPYVIW
ncbi:MAG: hypothetical protein KDK39_12765 [Leptospiraceae bacterium]|nr:hypothetical protein [Leptospiraceae bacterium]